MSNPLGKYRNRLGVELEVTGYRIDRNIIGTIYEAVIPDSLFGPRYVLITPEGLKECAYEKVESEANPSPSPAGPETKGTQQ